MSKVIVGNGIPCPRCHRPTEIRTHEEVPPMMFGQTFFYRQWFYCCNPLCRTTTVMRDDDRVFCDDVDDDVDADALWRRAAIAEQLRRRR
jgi:hypothetical protein